MTRCYTAGMTFLRLYRRFGAWLAILALLAGALSPTLAQAMVAGSDRADWLEVCSVSGMVWVKADTGEVSDHQPDDGQPVSSAVQHCPWCTLHGASAGLPPVDPPAFVLGERATDLPPAFYRAPVGATVWASAHSRAPPLTT